MAKDYYSILGVDKNAAQDEIKKAYRKLAHKYHPDKTEGDEKKFKEINEAYQILGKPEKRKQYDQFGTAFEGGGFGNASGGGFNWQDFTRQAGTGQGFGGFGSGSGDDFGGFDLGDIFEEFFTGRGRTRQQSRRGRDLEYKMQISLKESAFGGEKEIKVKKMEKCDKCEGKGYDSSAKIINCPQCQGAGMVNEQRRTIFGVFQSQRACPTCSGEGKKPDKYCFKCHGAGRVEQEKKIKVTIPAGVNNGDSIKLSGEGEAGAKGVSAGDLYITFLIATDDSFSRQGDDILSHCKISVTQAILGDKIDVDTLEGGVALKVPAGTQSGTKFRLRSKGAYKLHGRGRGDHIVEIEVEIPKKLSKKGKKLVEELSQEL